MNCIGKYRPDLTLTLNAMLLQFLELAKTSSPKTKNSDIIK